MRELTREQEGFLEDLALQHGRVSVDPGYLDGSVQMTTPNCVTKVVDTAGNVTATWRSANHTNWSYE
jgi:hypothetical protein